MSDRGYNSGGYIGALWIVRQAHDQYLFLLKFVSSFLAGWTTSTTILSSSSEGRIRSLAATLHAVG